MYKHILIPTDGSALSDLAIRQGMAFAKSIDAKVTVLTVSLPYQTFTVDPVMVTAPPEQSQRDCVQAAERFLTSGARLPLSRPSPNASTRQ